jgi:hypothetical protein
MLTEMKKAWETESPNELHSKIQMAISELAQWASEVRQLPGYDSGAVVMSPGEMELRAARSKKYMEGVFRETLCGYDDREAPGA